MLLSLEVKLAIAAVALAAAVGIGWKWRDYQATADDLDRSNQVIADVKAALVKNKAITDADAAGAKTLEELLGVIQEQKTKIITKRETEYVAHTVYRDCVLPASGVRILNQAIAAGGVSNADPGKR